MQLLDTVPLDSSKTKKCICKFDVDNSGVDIYHIMPKGARLVGQGTAAAPHRSGIEP